MVEKVKLNIRFNDEAIKIRGERINGMHGTLRRNDVHTRVRARVYAVYKNHYNKRSGVEIKGEMWGTLSGPAIPAF